MGSLNFVPESIRTWQQDLQPTPNRQAISPDTGPSGTAKEEKFTIPEGQAWQQLGAPMPGAHPLRMG
eukprot:CAMPEP_0174352198 /NCGR_PEP_ID=MMETSP0811_2-20130205/9794_1 /TAXON_ID=73025 ORGANISM="Eutreptiella gymnastica-like, Strain CCMP1594" /NCGR_SAMPLE_ID=MMETSP0811_2 /ASSEMBLY_ACC=CAM_ASM_000667 /LENGTH=66 /DNA_ID=CAMNT_0015482179 /DNA_START=587 /DNA_END=787 /DNA_ORIENTATION=+